MTMLVSDATISTKIINSIPTGIAPSLALTLAGEDRCENREAWQAILDYTLVEWGRNPSQLAEDGLIPPSAYAIVVACQVAQLLRDHDKDAPLRVVPTGDGGIVFERRQGEIFETLEIQDDGSVEWAIFSNGRLSFRRLWL